MAFSEMNRSQIQALCTQHKIKANGKTVTMRAELLKLFPSGSEPAVEPIVDVEEKTPQPRIRHRPCRALDDTPQPRIFGAAFGAAPNATLRRVSWADLQPVNHLSRAEATEHEAGFRTPDQMSGSRCNIVMRHSQTVQKVLLGAFMAAGDSAVPSPVCQPQQPAVSRLDQLRQVLQVPAPTGSQLIDQTALRLYENEARMNLTINHVRARIGCATLQLQSSQKPKGKSDSFETTLLLSLMRKYYLRLGLQLVTRTWRLSQHLQQLHHIRVGSKQLKLSWDLIRQTAARGRLVRRVLLHRAMYRFSSYSAVMRACNTATAAAVELSRTSKLKSCWKFWKQWLKRVIKQMLNDDTGWHHFERRRVLNTLLFWLMLSTRTWWTVNRLTGSLTGAVVSQTAVDTLQRRLQSDAEASEARAQRMDLQTVIRWNAVCAICYADSFE
jgi:hypothetical protein